MTAALNDIQERGMQMRTVGQVSAEFGVTVRTLHHYDEIGLLRASERTLSGYRLYSDDDLVRLRQIVAYRRLGFGLDDVGSVLDAEADALGHLQRQRAAVSQRMDELSALARALDRAMEAEVNGYQITTQEQREIFGEAFSDEYADEAQQRWGETDAWAQSSKRTKHYNKAQWRQIKNETDAINDAFAALLTAGVAASDDAAVAVAEQARMQIHTWFYDCSPQMHANIALMYVQDPRFMATYEEHTAGLARYVHDAVQENARRA
ncbi:MAG: MerR family transcriptional regulator [Ornithinimicrobium sp.]